MSTKKKQKRNLKSSITRKPRKQRKRHNESRRATYNTDPELREKVSTRCRMAYRKKANVEVRKALPPSKVGRVSKLRHVKELDKKIQTLNIKEMALALGGYHKIVIYRWVEYERFPAPPYTTEEGGIESGVYSLNQAKELCKVLAEHQKINSHFRATHLSIIADLYQVVADTL